MFRRIHNFITTRLVRNFNRNYSNSNNAGDEFMKTIGFLSLTSSGGIMYNHYLHKKEKNFIENLNNTGTNGEVDDKVEFNKLKKR